MLWSKTIKIGLRLKLGLLFFLTTTTQTVSGTSINSLLPISSSPTFSLCSDLGRSPQASIGQNNQSRGDLGAYEAYHSGMDFTSLQKLGLMVVSLPGVPGSVVVDMGSGSGQVSFELAQTFPFQVVGVDIDPISVSIAWEKYSHPRLTFLQGDMVRDSLFKPQTVSGFINSSVLHHVTSYNPGFNVGLVRQALLQQVRALKTDGILMIRDFIAPDDPQKKVRLILPGKDSPAQRLFSRFLQDFRSSIHPQGNIPVREWFEDIKLQSCEGQRVYLMDHRTAVEFVLRKDYEKTYLEEIREEYIYASIQDISDLARRLGLQILALKKIYNPWIVDNRFRGQFILSDAEGKKTLPFPPTNFLFLGEKVSSQQGVYFEMTNNHPLPHPRFLKMGYFRNVKTGEIWETVQRPNETVDLVPWFESDDLTRTIFVVMRKGYPRPLTAAAVSPTQILDSRAAGYLNEPMAALFPPGTPPEEAASKILKENAGSAASRSILEISNPMRYMTSPGGINELTQALLVQISPDAVHFAKALPRGSIQDTGFLQVLPADRVLTASQVGGLAEARMEINLYRLYHQKNRPLPRWIGSAIPLYPEPREAIGGVEIFDFEDLLNPNLTKSPKSPELPHLSDLHHLSNLPAASGPSGLFEPIPFEDLPPNYRHFLEVRSLRFLERNSSGRVLRKIKLESILPTGGLSQNTASVLPYFTDGSEIYVGLEERNFPAAQEKLGTSQLWSLPAWRLPREIKNPFDMEAWVMQSLVKDFQMPVSHLYPLGGEYFPSAGVTPEVVYPMVSPVTPATAAASPLRWVKLKDLLRHVDQIHDAHLLTTIFLSIMLFEGESAPRRRFHEGKGVRRG